MATTPAPGAAGPERAWATADASGAAPPARAFVLALVGAESTGKTQLAAALAGRVAALGMPAAVVGEYLREFCDTRGRTPFAHEQAAIAGEQTRRIDAARRALEDAATTEGAACAGVVVADTTALMTAVYSELVFGDRGLHDAALRDHAAACDLTLVAAPDLPWQADGMQRTGAHVQAPVDAALRALLARAGVPHAVVGGSGKARVDAAWRALRRAMRATAASARASC